MAAASVLLVEDDASLRLVTRVACEAAGFSVREAAGGREALDQAAAARPDVVVLDLMLPDMDGYDVCRELRRHDQRLPIIMVSARGEEVDKVIGLELGADDYLAKPFGTRELVARIRAQLRKALAPAAAAPAAPVAGAAPEAANGGAAGVAGAANAANPAGDGSVRVGTLTIDPAAREVALAGQALALTRTEFDILHVLARHLGQALTRAQIVSAVWGYQSSAEDRIVDSHIKNLRRKLAEVASGAGSAAPAIQTVPQVGYKLARSAPAAV
jgi:two-component system, OmpR family, response regulator RegX3